MRLSRPEPTQSQRNQWNDESMSGFQRFWDGE